MKPIRIKIDNIDYRKGCVEVVANIHPGCINLEAWDVDPNVDVSEIDVHGCDIPDDAVQANTELELSEKDAQLLIAALQEAISSLKKPDV